MTKTERHDQVPVVSIPSIECRFPFVALANSDKIIRTPEVQFGEDLRSLKTIKQFGYKRKRAAILNGNFVESTVVNARTQGPIFFF
ncbi:hypothetical protein FKM82_028963 [Ascaphus truei]